MNISGKDRRFLVKFVETMQELMKFDIGKETKADLAALEKVTEEAEAAGQKAKDREADAENARAKEIAARTRFLAEKADATAALDKREREVAERERLAGETARDQEARDKELARREKLLREAGVAGF